MGYYLQLKDYDKDFRQSIRPPIILNRFNTKTKDGKEELNRLLYISYQGDTLEAIPACECGRLTSEYNSELVCDVCHTSPRPVTERALESSLWMEPPDGVTSFISPTVWLILSKALYDNGQRMLQWMCSPTYTVGNNPKARMRKLMDLYAERGYQRGLNFFVQNFDAIFQMLLENRLLYNNKKNMTETLVEFIRMYRDRLFPTRLPLPSRLSFITEDTVTGRYADTSMTMALDAALTMSGVAHSPLPLSQKVKEARTVETINTLATFYETLVGKTLGRKVGYWRKHGFGSRLHQSARGVITSLSENHVYDEIHLPWSMAVLLFETHLTSKLTKRGFTPNEAVKFIYENTLKYNPLMDELLNELLNEGFGEAPWGDGIGGVPILLNRNPSLQRGSIQLLRITKIKTDPAINSISLSVLVLVGYNADFDGDALNLILVPDKRMYQQMKRLSPHLYTLDLRRPRAISGNLKMPSPVVTTIANWLTGARRTP
jgi:hypothetical protein